MKYSSLVIENLPKSFSLSDVLSYVEPEIDPTLHLPIQYDALPVECPASMDACVVYKYNESAAGVILGYVPKEKYVKVQLSDWANECDVYIFAAVVNAILAKHKRAKLHDGDRQLEHLTERDAEQMVEERNRVLKKRLAFDEGFCMRGLFSSYTLKVEHLRPALSPDMLALELRQNFLRMQWEKEED